MISRGRLLLMGLSLLLTWVVQSNSRLWFHTSSERSLSSELNWRLPDLTLDHFQKENHLHSNSFAAAPKLMDPTGVKDLPQTPMRQRLAPPQDVIDSLQGDLNRYLECLEQEICLDQDLAEARDSRDEAITNSQQLALVLKEFLRQVHEEHWQSDEIGDLAHAILALNDGNLKEMALELILSQDPRSDSVEPIQEYVLGYHDGNLIPLAVQEFQRHPEQLDDPQFHEDIIDIIRTGSFLVREQLVPMVGRLFRPNVMAIYQKALSDPRLDSSSQRLIRSQIREWQKQQTGA